MEFKLRTVGKIYSNKYDMDRLRELGFEFKQVSPYGTRFAIQGAPKIRFNSIDELMLFIRKHGECILHVMEEYQSITTITNLKTIHHGI